MQTNPRKIAVNKFPLRLMPSVRKVAEEYSQKEGVSLNQFINLAVAEKLVHLQHEAWLVNRPQPTEAIIRRGLAVLDRSTGNTPEEDDALPQGYTPICETKEYTRAMNEE